MKRRRAPGPRRAFEAALDVFRGLGASVRPVALPPMQQFDDARRSSRWPSCSPSTASDLRTRPELFGASLRYRIIAGGLVRAEDYVQAMRLRTDLARGHAGSAVDGRSADAADRRAGRKAGAGAAVEPVHRRVVDDAVQCRRQSGLVGVQRLCARTACRTRCRSSAGCSRTPRSCAPATPTKTPRPGVSGARCCSPGRPREGHFRMRPRRGDHGQTDERDRQRAEANVGGPQWRLLSGATYSVAGAMIASTFSNRRGTACGTSAGNPPSPPTIGNCNDSAVRCSHSDRLILEETQHGPIHRRLPVRQRPNCGVGTPIPGRPLSLSRLPQASWGPFSRFRGVPSGCGDDRWRNTRLRRAVFLSPLRLVRFRTQRRRNRSEPRIPGCP